MHMSLSLSAILTVVLSLCQPGTASAIYKWADDDGNVHYSQKPPIDRPAEKLKPVSTVDTAGAQKELERKREKVNTYLEKRDKLKKERMQAEKKRAENKARCERARNELAGVIAHYRVYVTNEAGERVRQSEDQRQARGNAARKNIAKYCG